MTQSLFDVEMVGVLLFGYASLVAYSTSSSLTTNASKVPFHKSLNIIVLLIFLYHSR
jgi:hypothetical protein